MIHPCIYICTPDFKLTPVKTEPLLRFPCHISTIFDKFVRKIVITIPFSPHRDEFQYKMHPVRDILRETDAHITVCVFELLASFPIHFDGRYYIDYISMHTRWKICNDVDGAAFSVCESMSWHTMELDEMENAMVLHLNVSVSVNGCETDAKLSVIIIYIGLIGVQIRL